MSEEKHYDLVELLGGSVAAITASFSDLSGNQLAMLAEAERASEKPRQTLLSAVETEQAARAAQAEEARLSEAAQPAMQQGQEAAAKVLAMGNGTGISSERENELMVRIEDLEGENFRLRAELAARDEGGAAQGTDTPQQPQKPVFTMKLCEAMERPSVVMFAGHKDRVLTDLTALNFMSHQFRAENGGITLDKPIDFPLHGTPQEVHSVWVVDAASIDGGEVLTGWACHLVRPMHVGGGRGAQIPAGHLLFTGADKA